jgi:hypothetical protein
MGTDGQIGREQKEHFRNFAVDETKKPQTDYLKGFSLIQAVLRWSQPIQNPISSEYRIRIQ